MKNSSWSIAVLLGLLLILGARLTPTSNTVLHDADGKYMGAIVGVDGEAGGLIGHLRFRIDGDDDVMIPVARTTEEVGLTWMVGRPNTFYEFEDCVGRTFSQSGRSVSVRVAVVWEENVLATSKAPFSPSSFFYRSRWDGDFCHGGSGSTFGLEIFPVLDLDDEFRPPFTIREGRARPAGRP